MKGFNQLIIKPTILVFIVLFAQSLSFGQLVQIGGSESFETAGGDIGYVTANEFDDVDAEDEHFLLRLQDGNSKLYANMAGENGTWYYVFGKQDVPANPNDPIGIIELDPIDISDYGDIEVRMLLGSTQPDQYEDGDNLEIYANIDGGGDVLIGNFEQNGGNSRLRQDTDLNGNDDGGAPELTATFQSFTFPVSGTGSSLVIKIQGTNNSGTGREQTTVDNIRVFGQQVLSAGALATPASISSMETAYSSPSAPQVASQIIFDFNITVASGETRVQFDAIDFHLADIGINWANVIADAQLYSERISDNAQQFTITSTGFSGTNNSVLEFTGINDGNNQIGDVNQGEAKLYQLRLRLSSSIPLPEREAIDGANINISLSSADFNVTSGTMYGSNTVTSGNVPIVVTATRYAVTAQPTVVALNTNFGLTVQAQDPNGNLDVDNTSAVTLARGTGTGSLSSVIDADLTSNLSSGEFSWTDLRFDTNEIFDIDATGSLTTGTSASIDVSPSIASIVAPANDTYALGENVDFTVNFDEPVTITGTPRIAVTLANGGPEFATFQSGTSPGTAHVFRYTVDNNDLDSDGLALVSPLQLNSGTINDAGGNPTTLTFTPPNTTGVLVDGVAPTVSIGTPSLTDANNSSTVDFSINYSGADNVNLQVSDVNLIDGGSGTSASIAILNGTTSNPTVRLTSITGNGTLTISIDPATSSDNAGNTDAGDGPATTFNVDNDPPTVSIGAPSLTDANNSSMVDFSITYTGADNVNLQASDVNLIDGGSGTSASIAILNGTTSNPTVRLTSITGNGTLTISIDPATSSDNAGNTDAGDGPATTFNVDNDPPTVSIGAPSLTDANNSSTVDFSITYTGADNVNLQASDVNLIDGGSGTSASIAILNGTTSNPTVRLTSITGNGTLTISIDPATSSDNAGNTDAGNGPATTFNVDNDPPTVSIGAPSLTDANNSSTVDFSITYTGADNVNLQASDVNLIDGGSGTSASIAILNGTTSNPTVRLTSITGNGTLTISIDPATSSDNIGNTDVGDGPGLTFNVDNTGPTSTATYTFNIVNNGDLQNVMITFSEAVTGTPTISLVGTSSGSIFSNQVMSGAGDTWSFNAGSVWTGDETITITLGTATDALGNPVNTNPSSNTFAVDNTGARISSIMRADSNPHNAGINSGSVDFDVVFNETVTGVDITDFSFNSSGLIGAPSISGVSGSGQNYTATVSGFDLNDSFASGTLNLDLNSTGTILDATGNDNTIATVIGVDETYTIINPEPAEDINQVSFISTGQTSNTITLSWTNSATAQIAYQHLLLVKESGSFPNPADGNFIVNDLDLTTGTTGQLAINVPHGQNSYIVTGLNSGTSYDFEIYPYTNSGTNVNYRSNTPATLTQSTPVASFSRLVNVTSAVSLSSLTDTQGEAIAASPSFRFNIHDDGGITDDNIADNAKTEFTQIIFTQGAGNAIADWTTVIAGARLEGDEGNDLNSEDDGGQVTIQSDRIIFSGITHGNDNLGEVDDDEEKTYTLRIWLSSNLPDGIDNQDIVFELDAASITPVVGSSGFDPAFDNVNSFDGRNAIDIDATQLIWNVPPSANIGVGASFASALELWATDENNNRDLNFVNSLASLSNSGGIGMANTPVGSLFTLGSLTFPSNFNFTGAGDGTLTPTATGPLTLVSPTSNPITVSYSNNTTITAGPYVSTVNLTPEPGFEPYIKIAEFRITDDDTGTTINDVVPTVLSSAVFTLGTGTNRIETNWDEIIQEAVLFDGGSAQIITPPAIGSNTLTFASIPAGLNTIPDSNFKIYQLFILLAPNAGPNVADIIDNRNFVFNLSSANVSTTAASSTIAAAQSVDTNNLHNYFDITADNLQFVDQPSTTFINETMSPSVSVEANGFMGIRDLDYAGTAHLTSTGSLVSSPIAVSLTSGLGTSPAIVHNALGNSLTLSAVDVGALLTSTPASTAFNIIPGNEESDVIASSFSYEENIMYELYTGALNNSFPKLFEIDINDGTSGGSPTDTDALPTNVTSISFAVNNFQPLNQIAIFDNGNNQIGSAVPAAGLVTFNFAPALVVPDDGSVKLHLRASYNTSVVDNTQFSFTVSSVVANDQGSSFESINGARTSESAATSSISGDDNRIEVTRTQLVFDIITAASLNTPFNTTIRALDNNNNLDLDFNETVTDFSNSAGLTTNPASITGNFNLGILSPIFEFTQAADGITLEVETATFDGTPLVAGLSNSFNVSSSDESNIILAATPPATFQYVNFTDADITGAGNAYELARFSINDGGIDLTDDDGASTTLDEITFFLTNEDNIRSIAIYDGITEIDEMAGGPAVINFTGLGLEATDNTAKEFIVYVTFNEANVTDGELQQITITDVVELGGSLFEFDQGGLVNGTGAGTPAGTNVIDVVATEYNFVNSPTPNTVEGVGVALLSTPSLEAVDINGIIDTNYNGAFSINTGGALINFNSGNFTNGLVTLTGLQYNTVGDGTLTLVENPLNTVTNGQGFNVSSSVEVVTTAFSQIDISAYPPQDETVLPSGITNRVLVGFNLDAQSNDPAFEVHFTNVEIDFSQEHLDIYENFRIYKIVGASTQINVGFTLVPGSSVDLGLSTNSTILINGFDEILDLNTDNRYLIVADVSVAAGPSSGSISASVTPNTSYLNSDNGNMLGATALGNTFSFVDSRDPEISATFPVNKSITAPEGNANYFTITFDEDVFSNNPTFRLFDFATNNLVSEHFTFEPAGGIEPDKTYNVQFYQTDLLIAPVVLTGGFRYYITLQQNGFIDQAGNTNKTANTGATDPENDITNKGFWNFTTIDDIPPQFKFDVDNSELLQNTYDLGFDLKVKLNEPATIFVRVLPAGSTDGDVADLFTNPDATVSAPSEDSFYFVPLRGLSSGTTYDIYVGAEDVGGNPNTFPTNIDLQSIQRITVPTNSDSGSDPVILDEIDVELCVGEFQLINAPISIIESADDIFETTNNIIDIILPNGYQFNTAAGQATALPFEGSGDLSDINLNYINNSTLRLSFIADNQNDRDEVRITNLEIKADVTASSGVISVNSNITGLFDLPAINLNLTPPSVATFSLNPPSTVINTSIPDQEIQLTQDIPVDEFVGATYEFSGPGVVDDILYVDLAGLGFKTITLTQTSQFGCQSVGSTEINIVNNQFTGLDFNYCSNQPVVPITIDGEGSLLGYRLTDLSVSLDGIPVERQADLNSFVTDGSTYSFIPEMAIPDDNNEEFVELLFEGEYTNNQDNNDVISLSQTVRVYPIPTISLTSSTFPDDVDGTIEVCEDFGNIIFVGQPEESNQANGEYELFNNNTLQDGTSEIILNSDGSITINSQAVANNANLGPGLYTLRYSYQNNISTCNGIAEILLFIYDKPTVDFTFNNSCEDQETNFVSSVSSSFSDLTGALYEWDFDDLSAVSNEENPTHIFDSDGNNDVSLTVTTDKGCFNEAVVSVAVGAIPQTSFNFTGVNISDEFVFTSTTPDPSASPTDNINEYLWDFGDGNSSIVTNPTNTEARHTYNATLLDTVRLTVTSTLGCSETLAKPLAVLDKFDPITAPSNGFETDAEGWVTLTSVGNSWTLSSNNADIQQDGNNLWVTNPNQPYLENETSYVYSPTYDFSSIDRPLVSFDAFWDLVNGGVLLQYSTDNLNIADPQKNWEILGEGELNSGEDWYNRTELSLPTVNTGIAWSDSVGLQEPRHVLDFITAANRNNVNFRFAFLSQDSDPSRPGFAFDNFVIGERTRTVLLENFTNSSETTITLNQSNFLKGFDIEDEVGTILVKVNYHTDFPGDDPINEANKVDPSARALFYDVTQTPKAIIDGTITDPEGRPFSQWGEDSFNLRSLILAEFEIGLNVTAANGELLIEATPIPQTNGVLNEDLILMAMVLEKEVTLNELGVSSVPSGENDFEFVLRKLLPNAAGRVLNTEGATSGTPMATQTFSWSPINVIDPTDLAVVVIVQNENTKEVYQSEIWLDVPDPGAITGLKDGISSTNFTLYPNPANTQLNLLVSSDLVGKTLRVYDNFGKLILDREISATEISLDTRDYASGMYHIQIINDTQIFRERVIISHNDR
ncbi:PKD domain-containing protein [Fulvivirga lutea]|uniref:T9SS type A sorting domain-containing protein n=1 Tax=Fulvivirga lutea TaxID=2810512 RepID=A0A974WHL6_9BACT|nr:PKD domain-containing protein [Fulvivirga lutea]QSE96260.1 T9SS type A sorting domain-containing protein [Fulvivirga lutea]